MWPLTKNIYENWETDDNGWNNDLFDEKYYILCLIY